jgi:hypothetical protein
MVLVKAQFCKGKHFKWSTSLIHKIMDNVRFAKLINCPFYLEEWLFTPANRQRMVGNNRGGRSYGGGTVRGQTENQTRDSTPRGGTMVEEEEIGPQPWVDDCHPCIVAMMADYMAAPGLWVQLINILDASNKCITDLPTIPKYVNTGCSFVCWVHILGRSRFPISAFKNRHIQHSSIPKAFTKEVVTMITLGGNHCARAQEQEGLPGKRQRADPQN